MPDDTPPTPDASSAWRVAVDVHTLGLHDQPPQYWCHCPATGQLVRLTRGTTPARAAAVCAALRRLYPAGIPTPDAPPSL